MCGEGGLAHRYQHPGLFFRCQTLGGNHGGRTLHQPAGMRAEALGYDG